METKTKTNQFRRIYGMHREGRTVAVEPRYFVEAIRDPDLLATIEAIENHPLVASHQSESDEIWLAIRVGAEGGVYVGVQDENTQPWEVAGDLADLEAAWPVYQTLAEKVKALTASGEVTPEVIRDFEAEAEADLDEALGGGRLVSILVSRLVWMFEDDEEDD